MMVTLSAVSSLAPRTTPSLSSDALFTDYIFLALTLIFLLDLVVRLIGLGWSFLLAGWNLFDLASIIGVAATTLPVLLTQQDEVLPGIGYEVASQLQKLFLVGVAFKLVQKVDKLNRFFKVAAASLPCEFARPARSLFGGV